MNNIKIIVTHGRAHLEEFLITYLFARFGKKVGYKISPNFVFKENTIGAFGNQGRSLDSWVASEILPVGTLGAIDEHPVHTGNRHKEGSAVALASKILFKDRQPVGFRKLIRFVSDEDQKAGKGEYNLAYMVKIIHSMEGMANDRIYKWLNLFFKAEDYIQWKKLKTKKNSKLLQSLFDRYKKEENNVNMSKFRRFLDGKDPAVLENYNLSVIVNILHTYGVPVNEIYVWVKFFFDAERHRQDVVWPRAQSKAAKNLELWESQSGPKVAFFESDEEVAHMVVRVVAKPDLTIIKRSTGHIQMFATSKGYGQPSIVMTDKVVHMLRATEGSFGTTEELTSENFEGSPWYFHVVAQNVLNGSHSAPDVPATELPMDVIKSLVLANIRYRPAETKVAKPMVSIASALKGVKLDKKGKIKTVS